MSPARLFPSRTEMTHTLCPQASCQPVTPGSSSLPPDPTTASIFPLGALELAKPAAPGWVLGEDLLRAELQLALRVPHLPRGTWQTGRQSVLAESGLVVCLSHQMLGQLPVKPGIC